MDIDDRRSMKAAARKALSEATYDPRKLILIHTGAMVMLSLAISVISHILNKQIGDTGGLSGIGLRSILETVESVLLIGQMAAMVFWQIGYVFVSLRISRGGEVAPGSLLEGFRRFGPVLRLQLSLYFQYTGVVLLGAFAGSIIFSYTPMAAPLTQAVQVGTEEALLLAIDQVMVPLTAVTAVVMLIIGLPYVYRLRLAAFALMDNPKAGASRAILNSRLMMRHNRMNLLKLDISFWWFYLLQLVTMVVAYGDYILPIFGYTLPWSDTVSYYVFLILSYGGQLALYWWRGNEVQVTYAKFYEALLPEEE